MRVLQEILIVACISCCFSANQYGGMNIGIRLTNLFHLENQVIDNINKTYNVDLKPIHSITLNKFTSGDYVSYFPMGNYFKIQILNPVLDVTVLRDHTIIWGTTTDDIKIHFKHIYFLFDLDNREHIIYDFELEVTELKSSNKFIPDNVLNFFATKKLNDFLKGKKIKEQVNQVIMHFIKDKRIVNASENMKLNLTHTEQLTLQDLEDNLDKFSSLDYNSHLLLFPIDGSATFKDVAISKDATPLSALILPNKNYVKDVNIYVSDYSLESILRSKIEEEGGINSKLEESGFTVTINSIKERPLNIKITKTDIVVTILLKISPSFRGIKKEIEAEVKLFVNLQLDKTLIKLEISNIDFNAGLFTNIIKLPFINLSEPINRAVTNALRSGVHLPTIDIAIITESTKNNRVNLEKPSLLLIDNYIQLGYDTKRVQ